MVLTLPAFGQNHWNQMETRHFLIYYNNAPLSFIDEVAQASEEYYDEISDDLKVYRFKDWRNADRAKIYIYDNIDHYVYEGNNIGWSHGVASPKDKIIRSYPAAHGFFDTTLPHEITHIIFRELIGFQIPVPLWFEEGIAMQQERAKRWGAHDDVYSAVLQDKFMSVSDLKRASLGRNASQETVNLFYTQSASLVAFLIEKHGQKKFNLLVRLLSQGQSFEKAFSRVYPRYHRDEDLTKAWLKFLEQKVR